MRGTLLRNIGMKRHLYMTYLAAFLLMTISPAIYAQEKIGGKVEFDRTVCDFGDVMLSDGPLHCTFTMKNISDKPVVIYNVVTSCGCTDVQWTKEPIMPGKTGTISSTYTNDEGPYPFDKNLTAYISGISTPVILKLRGISHEKQLSLEEMYPVRFGSLGMRRTQLKCGNLEQGGYRSDDVKVANLSSSPLKITFTDITPGLAVEISPNPIPARSTADLRFTVKADRSRWGKNFYYATPLVNGKRYSASEDGEDTGRISVYAFTKENFSSMTKEQRDNGSRPVFNSSTYSFGKIKAGTPVKATFSFSNIGKSDFKVYKVDTDWPDASSSAIPVVGCGMKGAFEVNLDTSSMPDGEALVIVTLTTNSPSRPIVNLFITGWIE